ncbi:MAG: aminomethyl-transferring glycine dehydrogenase subunit GcvPB [Tissierellia bacterium]|nr:aminomethyl-transferring glycine dehydrogenase subunit GcvPB [Tissierellia bacterium]
MMSYDRLIFENSVPGKFAYSLPKLDVPEIDPSSLGTPIREELDLPEVSEGDLIRHYVNISTKNFSIDKGFYPLGSCTMKYNPKINENVARIPGLSKIHPYQPQSTVQGSLALLYELQEYLAEVSGMDTMTLQPAAGAQGELAGLMIIKKYHELRGDHHRTKIILPDSAHGTNPATTAMAGFELVEIPSDEDGSVDIEELKAVIDGNLAGLMLTNPNTLGLFEGHIEEVTQIIHDAGGLIYYDGANMNAIMGRARPGDMGFDVMHFNVHKTFSTPHGGGGPGAGPVGVKAFLREFLPVPLIEKEGENYVLNYDLPNSIGKVKAFYGNYGILVRTFSYISTMGGPGLREASEMAVLNANYLMERLKKTYRLPIDKLCKHEFVLSGIQAAPNVSTLDIAKRLMDFGFHPPTVYFPLIIPEAMMIEPTETESRDTLDRFMDALEAIAKEAVENPELLHNAPYTTPVRRIDEVYAAKALILTYKDMLNEKN